jgi:hypothetical protein
VPAQQMQGPEFKTKQNKTKQNKTKQNKTKQNKTDLFNGVLCSKRMRLILISSGSEYEENWFNNDNSNNKTAKDVMYVIFLKCSSVGGEMTQTLYAHMNKKNK